MVCLLLIFSFLFLTQSEAQISLSPSPILTAIEGRDVSFTCAGTIGPQVVQVNSNITNGRLTITNEGGGEGSGINEGTTIYQMDTLTRADNGTTLQCFINGESSNIITLIVDFPPLYSPNTVSYSVMEGSDPIIILGLDAAPRITSHTWTHNGIALTNTESLIVSVNRLMFSSISRTASGVYEVIARDELGNGTATVNLDVYYAPEFTVGGSVINRTVVAGNDITLSCAVSAANPDITNITLTHDIDATNIDTSSGNSFIINSASTSNEGTYTCTATNLVAITELTYNLVVGSLPVVTIQLTFSFTDQSVIIRTSQLIDDSPQAVLRFHVTINSVTYTVSSFPLTIDASGLVAGQTYSVQVIAENSIGNSTVLNTSFTLPSPPTPTPTVTPTSDTTAAGTGVYSSPFSVVLVLMMMAYAVLSM